MHVHCVPTLVTCTVHNATCMCTLCIVRQCLLLAQCTLQRACAHCALCANACYLHSTQCNVLVHIVHCLTMLVPTLVTCRSPQDQRPTAQATRVACCAPTACYVAYVCPAHWRLLCVSVCPALLAPPGLQFSHVIVIWSTAESFQTKW